MAVFALVEKGVVANIVELESAAYGKDVFSKQVEIVAVADGDAATIGGTWDGTAFAPPPPPMPTLEEARDKQASAISAACAAAITGGFQSAALGKVHTYPSDQTDQANLTANVVSSMKSNLPDNWTTPQLCSDSEGVWTYRMHTAAQIQQVGEDGKAAIMACLLRNATLRDQISAATTVEAVQAITWSAP